MRTRNTLLSIAATIAIASPGIAQARIVNLEVPGIRISGATEDLGGYTYDNHSIRVSFEHEDSWTLRCGEYVAQALLLRLGPRGQQNYQRHQLARILGSIDRIEIRRVRGGILGTPAPTTRYFSGDRRLVVEFDMDSSGTGLNYCGFGSRGGTIRSIHQAWARFERLSRRRDDAEVSLASAPAPGDTRPVVDVAAGDRATARALSGFMTEAINSVGGAPAAPVDAAATDRRTAPVVTPARVEEIETPRDPGSGVGE